MFCGHQVRFVMALVTSIEKVILDMIYNLQKEKLIVLFYSSSNPYLGGLVRIPYLGTQKRVAQRDDGRRRMRRGGQTTPFRQATSSASGRVSGRRHGNARASHPAWRTARATARGRGGRASTSRSRSWRWGSTPSGARSSTAGRSRSRAP